jgi:hypothetical protein
LQKIFLKNFCHKFHAFLKKFHKKIKKNHQEWHNCLKYERVLKILYLHIFNFAKILLNILRTITTSTTLQNWKKKSLTWKNNEWIIPYLFNIHLLCLWKCHRVIPMHTIVLYQLIPIFYLLKCTLCIIPTFQLRTYFCYGMDVL